MRPTPQFRVLHLGLPAPCRATELPRQAAFPKSCLRQTRLRRRTDLSSGMTLAWPHFGNEGGKRRFKTCFSHKDVSQGRLGQH